ncbi:PTR2-domain-containing protein [Gloeophyllum trabeum ATCC 11539]|uniref:PTR2-domain-containing protein n=1 Tax=Gloeophyllum trabeum (strain ATCC 11539 / FP-39264 / Madison 617) TaxID=670483 RepID=S7PU59_GLOTA|nr:PTR2-domain-containing protein [Gloeophyllum trabeum ATCC 11539]EPQ51346.1 PTR2-domain-containing protein [Gloeophyllum trabeum ATCC 11539]
MLDYEAGALDGQKVLTPPKSDEKVLERSSYVVESLVEDDEGRAPTEEEKNTLRRVSAKVPWASYVICLVEFSERASYYGVSGIFPNYIQRPLPKGGNGAGAPPRNTQETAGALGLGLTTANALTTLFSFLACTTPIIGAILADTKWGRFKTICVGTAVALLAHIILIISAVPSVIQEGHAIIAFIIGLLVLAFSTGMITPCVAPLIADQSPVKSQIVQTLPSGERVILDPSRTIENMLMMYYWAINVGALFQLATSYSEKDVGYWLAYLTPTILFLLVPLALVWVYKRLVKYPPRGSGLLDAIKAFSLMIRRTGFRSALRGGDRLWESAKPSTISSEGGEHRKSMPSWDDEFIDDLRKTVNACKVFAFFPVWYMADGGLNTIQNSMAASMTTNGAPNDLLSNFNPISTIVTVPFYNYILYPFLRKHGINFSPIRRIVTGFCIGVLTMIIGAILQWQVYRTSPCGYGATTCDIGTGVSPIRVWAQVPLYWLPPMGGILINVTAYEIAYTRSPARMKGIVMAMILLMSAFSSALVEICSPAFKDPNLIWPFVGVGAANGLAAILIWYFFRGMDDEEVVLRGPELASRSRKSSG